MIRVHLYINVPSPPQVTMARLPVLLLALYLYVADLDALPTPALTPASTLPPVTPGRASGGLMADEGPSSGLSDDTTPHEVLGACRATCVEQTLEWPPSDDMCLQDSDCLTVRILSLMSIYYILYHLLIYNI